MNIEELQKIIPYCISCGRHCSFDSLHCTKGQEFILGLLYTMNVLENGKKDMEIKSKFTVLYFTGTGNSAYVANKIAKSTGGNIICINDMLKSGTSGEIRSGENIIICAPVYAWRIPAVVEKWLRDVSLPDAEKVWFLLTCGSEIGNAAKYCRGLSVDKGLKYMGTASFLMPCNHITMFEVPDKQKADEIVSRADPVMEKCAREIFLEKELAEDAPGLPDRLKSSIITPIFYKMFIRTKPFYVLDSCIGCGKCALMCPLNNIKIVDGTPQWGNNCTHCLSCICRCLESAIEYGK